MLGGIRPGCPAPGVPARPDVLRLGWYVFGAQAAEPVQHAKNPQIDQFSS